jgi:phosphohistidine phosphatase
MKLYIIRHAPAELRHEFALTGQPDHQRPITEKGVERTRDMIKFFKKSEDDVQLFLQSPLVRSQQTGDIFRKAFPKARFIDSENLSPDHSAQSLYEEILSYDVDSMGVIGHEPDLGQFLSWLLFRQATDHFPFKKSGMARVDLYQDGRTYLKWIIRPKLVLD